MATPPQEGCWLRAFKEFLSLDVRMRGRGQPGKRAIDPTWQLLQFACLKVVLALLLLIFIGLSCWIWPSASVLFAAASSVLILGASNAAILATLLRRRSESRSLQKCQKATTSYLVGTEVELLKKQWPGVSYRNSKFYEDTIGGDFACWGTVIAGIDDGDGWIRVTDSSGDKFLPSMIRGHAVLQRTQVALEAVLQKQMAKAAGKGGACPPPPGSKGKGKGKGKGKKGPLAQSTAEQGAAERRMEKVTPKVQVKRLYWDHLVITDSKPTFWSQISPEDNRDEKVADTAMLEKLFNTESTPSLGVPGVSTPSSRQISAEAKEKKLQVFEKERRKKIGIVRACLPRLPDIRFALVHMMQDALTTDQVEVLANSMPSEAEVKAMEKARFDHYEELKNGSCCWDVAEEFMDNLLSIPNLDLRIRILSFENGFLEEMGLLKRARGALSDAIRCVRESPTIRHLFQIALFTGNYLNAGTSRERADGFSLDCLLQLQSVKMTATEKRGGTLIDYIVWQMERAHTGDLAKMDGPGQECELLKEAARHGLKDRMSEVNNLAMKTTSLLETVRALCEKERKGEGGHEAVPGDGTGDESTACPSEAAASETTGSKAAADKAAAGNATVAEVLAGEANGVEAGVVEGAEAEMTAEGPAPGQANQKQHNADGAKVDEAEKEVEKTKCAEKAAEKAKEAAEAEEAALHGVVAGVAAPAGASAEDIPSAPEEEASASSARSTSPRDALQDLSSTRESAEARAARKSLKPHLHILDEHWNEVQACQKAYQDLKNTYEELLEWFVLPKGHQMNTMEFFGIFTRFLSNVMTSLKKYEAEQRLEAERKAHELTYTQIRARSSRRRHSIAAGFRHPQQTKDADRGGTPWKQFNARRQMSTRRKTFCQDAVRRPLSLDTGMQLDSATRPLNRLGVFDVVNSSEAQIEHPAKHEHSETSAVVKWPPLVELPASAHSLFGKQDLRTRSISEESSEDLRALSSPVRRGRII